MAGGDHAPSYTTDQVIQWLRNDLANIPQGTPLYFFNHDIPFGDDRFVYKGRNDSINLRDHNLKAWIYGHLHINHKRSHGQGVYSMCTSTPDKGGIDHSTSAYRVVNVDGKGNSTVDTRYTYIHNHATVASPIGITSATNVIVNTYSSVSYVKNASYTCYLNGKPIGPSCRLSKATDWTWTAPLRIPAALEGKRLTLKATVEFNNGERIERASDFTYRPGAVDVTPT